MSEFYEIGGEEYFENGICLIEWGELISDALPSDFMHITFEKDSKNEDLRILNIQTYGNKFNSILMNIRYNPMFIFYYISITI